MSIPGVTRPILAIAFTAVALSGCGGAGIGPTATTLAGTPSTTTSPPTTTTTLDVTLVPTPTPTSRPVPDTSPDVPLPDIPEGVDPADVGYVTASIDLLAEATGADPADITIVGFEEIVWRDGSIGCPMPGMSYTQALVDGTRVALELDGTVYLFHVAGTGDPFLCQDPAEPLS